MTRHRHADDAVRIELDEGYPETQPAPRDGRPVQWGERRSSDDAVKAWRRPHELVATAGVLALVICGGLVASTFRDRAYVERLRDAPGGVLTLQHEPAEAWVRPADVGAVLTVPGAVVLSSAATLVALDPASGVTLWTVATGLDAVCGPADVDGAVPRAVDPVVCVHGVTERVATVVAATGEVVAERSVAAGTRPGSSGTVVRARRVGDPVAADHDASAACIETVCTFEGSIDQGRDVEVRAEDAVTGDERWTWRVPFWPAVVPDCIDRLSDGRVGVDAELTRVEGTPAFVRVAGCGVHAVFADDGRRLDPAGAGHFVDVHALPGGGYVTRGPQHDVLVDGDVPAADPSTGSDGEAPPAEGRELPGRLLLPRATDGSDPGVLLVDLGTRVRAEDREGRELWTAQAPAARLLVQAAGVALLDDGAGNVGAVDLGTGEELWRQNRLDDAAGLDVTVWAPTVEQAFTDGRRALVTMRGMPGDWPQELYAVAVDLRSGRIEWGTKLVGLHRLVAVDGELVGVGDGRLVGLTP